MVRFRHILGHYPTGVCAITSLQDGQPIGMAVGSFTSISLDPPLVAFSPDRRSQSWARIAQTGRFCVNVLGDHQEDLCRTFATSGSDKFAGVHYRCSPSGLPVLDGVVAWIDCDIHAVHEAGDHFIVLGAVHALDIGSPAKPLLFFQGRYGQFSLPIMAS